MAHDNKNFDIYYGEFADTIQCGDLGDLPSAADAVSASETAQRMVEAAMAGHVPCFGTAAALAALGTAPPPVADMPRAGSISGVK